MGFFIKVIMTCSTVFITNNKWLAVVELIMAGLLVYLYCTWVSRHEWSAYSAHVLHMGVSSWPACSITLLHHAFSAYSTHVLHVGESSWPACSST